MAKEDDLFLFPNLRHAIIRAAKAAAPNELAAVIMGDELVVLENVAPDPLNNFAISTADMGRYVYHPDCKAVVHSHPAIREEGKNPVPRLTPTASDMQHQLDVAKPYVIAAENPEIGTWEVFDFGEHVLDYPILGRPFRHGVEDCYTLIRKWFWQNRFDKLIPMPRDDMWFGREIGEDPIPVTANLYIDHFEKCGAERVYPRGPKDLIPGDVFLFKFYSKVWNHGGVYVGEGKVWHHPPGRYSIDMLVTDAWFRRTIWLRKKELSP